MWIDRTRPSAPPGRGCFVKFPKKPVWPTWVTICLVLSLLPLFLPPFKITTGTTPWLQIEFFVGTQGSPATGGAAVLMGSQRKRENNVQWTIVTNQPTNQLVCMTGFQIMHSNTIFRLGRILEYLGIVILLTRPTNKMMYCLCNITQDCDIHLQIMCIGWPS